MQSDENVWISGQSKANNNRKVREVYVSNSINGKIKAKGWNMASEKRENVWNYRWHCHTAYGFGRCKIGFP